MPNFHNPPIYPVLTNFTFLTLSLLSHSTLESWDGKETTAPLIMIYSLAQDLVVYTSLSCSRAMTKRIKRLQMQK